MATYKQWSDDINTRSLKELITYSKSLDNLLKWDMLNKELEYLNILKKFIDVQIETLQEMEEE